jgi:hypothetical protein
MAQATAAGLALPTALEKVPDTVRFLTPSGSQRSLRPQPKFAQENKILTSRNTHRKGT